VIETYQLDQVEAKEILPGFHGKMIHTPCMTLAFWQIEANASLPEHQHVPEQVVNMLEGEFELTVAGTPHILKPGDVLVIPPNTPHSGRAITACRILDVFHPVREDYR
jgi:quercetin dioxygenase-like cupin family protein